MSTSATEQATSRVPSPSDSAGSAANAIQVGGNHYRAHGKADLQHWDVVSLFKLDYFQGNISKYVFRWREKGGLQDLKKARHYLDKYIELETAKQEEQSVYKAMAERAFETAGVTASMMTGAELRGGIALGGAYGQQINPVYPPGYGSAPQHQARGYATPETQRPMGTSGQLQGAIHQRETHDYKLMDVDISRDKQDVILANRLGLSVEGYYGDGTQLYKENAVAGGIYQRRIIRAATAQDAFEALADGDAGVAYVRQAE